MIETANTLNIVLNGGTGDFRWDCFYQPAPLFMCTERWCRETEMIGKIILTQNKDGRNFRTKNIIWDK